MLPAIPPGARLGLVALAAADPRPGQVYLFEHPSGPRAHRFLGADAAGLHFRGDNARRSEVVAGRDALIGRVDALVIAGHRLRFTSLPSRVVVVVAGVGLELARILVPRALRQRVGVLLRRRLE